MAGISSPPNSHYPRTAGNMNQLLKTGLCYGVSWTGLMPAVRHMFAGRAVIIMFHEVQRDCRLELMTGISVALFEYSLDWLRQQGWEIVSLEECLDRIGNDDRSRRYAVLTFDDGYRDTVSVALPIIERCNVPFMVYVPTGAPKQTLKAWWLGLRQLFRSRDDVSIDAMEARFHCSDLQTKLAALNEVTEWIHDDYRRTEMLGPTFDRAGISLSELNAIYFLDEGALQVLGRHPLASIGGHTTSHKALRTLDAAAARAEIADNRNYLENLLQLPIRHLAYPYGGSRACGPREERLANDVGFWTAVTTRHGHLQGFPLNRFALPRIFIGAFDTRISVQAKLNGLQQAFDMLVGDQHVASSEDEDYNRGATAAHHL
jgi:peptidoglycan/xylan/chitin deacetylase (PgdA/CDA1 family)